MSKDMNAARVVTQQVLSKAKDQRIKNTIDYVQKACEALVNNSVEVTTANVAGYCKKHFGKPKAQTLYNDAKATGKGIYRSIINAYAKHNPQTMLTKQNKSQAARKGWTTADHVEYNHLIARNKLLENTLKEQFDIVLDREVISVNDTLLKGASLTDGAELTSSEKLTSLQISAIKKLLGVVTDLGGKVVETNGYTQLLDENTGESFLNAREYEALSSLLN